MCRIIYSWKKKPKMLQAGNESLQLLSKGHKGPYGGKCQNSEPFQAILRTGTTTTLSLLQQSWEEYREYEYSKEDEIPCQHCGAIEFFKYIIDPVANTMTCTCMKCGGPSLSSSLYM